MKFIGICHSFSERCFFRIIDLPATPLIPNFILVIVIVIISSGSIIRLVVIGFVHSLLSLPNFIDLLYSLPRPSLVPASSQTWVQGAFLWRTRAPSAQSSAKLEARNGPCHPTVSNLFADSGCSHREMGSVRFDLSVRWLDARFVSRRREESPPTNNASDCHA